MSSISRRHRREQEAIETKAMRVAAQLTPWQRRIVAWAGMPKWFCLQSPWRPLPGRQEVAAQLVLEALSWWPEADMPRRGGTNTQQGRSESDGVEDPAHRRE